MPQVSKVAMEGIGPEEVVVVVVAVERVAGGAELEKTEAYLGLVKTV